MPLKEQEIPASLLILLGLACRPAFLSVTALTLAGNYMKYRNRQRTALALAIAFGLAITPELVQLYNESRLPLLPGLGARIPKVGTRTMS